MINRARYGKQRSDRRGFALVEYALAVMLVAGFSSTVSCSFAQRIDEARAMRSLADMKSILEAGKRYFEAYGAWPVSMDDVGIFLTKSVGMNAWGHRYRLSLEDARFSIETDVPAAARLPVYEGAMAIKSNTGKENRWRMGIPLSYGRIARLVYEK